MPKVSSRLLSRQALVRLSGGVLRSTRSRQDATLMVPRARKIPAIGRSAVRCATVALACAVGAAEQHAIAEHAEGLPPETGAPEELLSELRSIRGELPIGGVHESPVPGIWAVELSGSNVVYGTDDGAYLFAGDLYAIDDGLTNLTESIREARRRTLISAMGTETMITFPSASTGAESHALFVFTDTDCPFCQALHSDVEKLNAEGVTVNYIAYPLAGIGSETHRQMVSAWCSPDPRAAITELMRGGKLPARECPNPVGDHFQVGRGLGLDRTPAVIAPDGRLLGGHIPYQDIVSQLRSPRHVAGKP